jgi:hypothetical protein
MPLGAKRFALGLARVGIISAVSVSSACTYHEFAPPLLSGNIPPSGTANWIGMNVSGGFVYNDITHQLNGFTATNGTALTSTQIDADGYPLAGVSGLSQTDYGYSLLTGDYKISYQGTGTLNVSGVGSLTGQWQNVGGEYRNIAHLTGTPGQFGRYLNLTITNQPGQTVTQIHLYMPGRDYDTAELFYSPYVALLAPFGTLRYMSVMLAGNGGKLTAWSQRRLPTQFGVTTLSQPSVGEPYEHVIALANETGADAWINLPFQAPDAFITQMADLFRDGLNYEAIAQLRAQKGISGPFRLFVEFGNEDMFDPQSAFSTAAAANPTLYDGVYNPSDPTTYTAGSFMYQDTGLMKIGQVEADRIAHAVQLFRTEFSSINQASTVQGILGGWSLGAGYSAIGLEFIKKHYGNPSDLIAYVTLTSYFGTSSYSSLAAIFSGMEASIASNAAVFPDFAKLAAAYQIQVAGYEGGASLAGETNPVEPPVANSQTNLVKLAQYDVRMYTVYNDFFTSWKAAFGKSLFNHFAYSQDGTPPDYIYQYGIFWAVPSVVINATTCGQNLRQMVPGTDVVNITDPNNYCPKYRSLIENATQ